MYLFKYTKLVSLKSAKLEQLMLCLMQFNCGEVVLKSNYIYIYLIVLKWNYCKYASGTL